MFRNICGTAVVVAGLTVSPPVASASDATFDCAVDAARVEGAAHEGVAAGFVVSPAGGEVAVDCVVNVNDVTVARTGRATGSGAAVTSGVVSFTATAADDVDVCAVVTDHGVTTTHCFQASQSEVPPPVLYDTVDGLIGQLWWIYPDPCWLHKLLAGTHGPVTINSQGDVYIDGEPFWDCPPYDVDWEPGP